MVNFAFCSCIVFTYLVPHEERGQEANEQRRDHHGDDDAEFVRELRNRFNAVLGGVRLVRGCRHVRLDVREDVQAEADADRGDNHRERDREKVADSELRFLLIHLFHTPFAWFS